MSYYQECNQRLGPQQMNYHFSISLKHSYFFCEVAKAGCSAAKTALWKQELQDIPLPPTFLENKKNPHAPFHHHILVKPFQLGEVQFNDFIKNESVEKWAIVRNPFSRALSGYLDKVKRGAPSAQNILRRVAANRNVDIIDITHESVSFAEYCKALKLFNKTSDFDQHWRPQYQHLCADILPYSFFVRLETLDAQAEKLSHRLGFKDLSFASGRPHATDATSKLNDYYTPELAEIIREVYHEDFTKLGYSLDLPASNTLMMSS